MEHAHLIKKLQLPPGVTAPTRLASSMALINETRGGDWPTEPVTDEYNYVDLVWHELEFRDGTSSAYVVRDDHGLPRLLLPLPDGAAYAAQRGAIALRRRRQLVGDSRSPRTRVLRKALRRTPTLAGRAVLLPVATFHAGPTHHRTASARGTT
jgi:hypothetical protein